MQYFFQVYFAKKEPTFVGSHNWRVFKFDFKLLFIKFAFVGS